MLLQVFAKGPVSGQVKTRLVPALTPDEAARLQRAFVQRALAVAQDAQLGPVELWCAPDITHPFFAECALSFSLTLRSQVGNDLGDRMRNAMHDALARDHAVLLMGTDCPLLDAAYVRKAACALRDHDAVFAPAEDGG